MRRRRQPEKTPGTAYHRAQATMVLSMRRTLDGLTAESLARTTGLAFAECERLIVDERRKRERLL